MPPHGKCALDSHDHPYRASWPPIRQGPYDELRRRCALQHCRKGVFRWSPTGCSPGPEAEIPGQGRPGRHCRPVGVAPRRGGSPRRGTRRAHPDEGPGLSRMIHREWSIRGESSRLPRFPAGYVPVPERILGIPPRQPRTAVPGSGSRAAPPHLCGVPPGGAGAAERRNRRFHRGVCCESSSVPPAGGGRGARWGRAGKRTARGIATVPNRPGRATTRPIRRLAIHHTGRRCRAGRRRRTGRLAAP